MAEKGAAEQARLAEARDKNVPWRKWGPYLSERQWGTVREDYSDDGNAWDYFTHDQARSRASFNRFCSVTSIKGLIASLPLPTAAFAAGRCC